MFLEKRKTSSNWCIYVCFLVMLLWGSMMVFFVPTWQTPDERAHIEMIGEEIGNPLLAVGLLVDMPLDFSRIAYQSEEKIDQDEIKEAMNAKPFYDECPQVLGKLQPKLIRHLPAVIGIRLALALKLPTFWIMALAEWFQLLFYVAVCAIAIKIMPVKKELMLLFMCFPMGIHQAASINYDAVLIPMIYLFIALMMKLIVEESKIGWGKLLFPLVWLGLISYIKPPYFLLGLLYCLIPWEKLELSLGKYQINGTHLKKYKFFYLAGVLVVAIAILVLLRNNFWIQLVLGFFAQGKHGIAILYHTITEYGLGLVRESVGMFGWRDSVVPKWFVLVTYLLVLVIACQKQEGKSKPKTSVAMLVIFGVIVLFVMLSMVNHTIMTIMYGSEYINATYDIAEGLQMISFIGGLQGRYFLPVIVLLFLAIYFGLPKREQKIPFHSIYLVLGYEVVAMLVSSMVLYQRYWS